MAAAQHDLHEGHWAALTAAWGGCAYCGATGTPLQRGCVQPVARGGRCPVGLVPGSALSLRRVGRTGSFRGWLRRKRLDERSFLLRHARITAELGALFAALPAAAG